MATNTSPATGGPTEATALREATVLVGPQVRRAALVPRARIDAVLDAAAAARLVVMSAPAGFGKTTVLADWLARRRVAFAWLTLDAASNDPARFLKGVRAAVAGIGEVPAGDVGQPGVEHLLDEVHRLAARGRFLLVLDDYHELTDRSIHDLVRTVIARLPERAQVVIATRSDPPLPLARLRARAELVEIRGADLRFDREEGAALLRCLGLEVSEAAASGLVERTEGWAAALQLAAVSLAKVDDPEGAAERFGASNRFVLDFIVDEVLARVGEDVRAFLLETSVADRLTGTLCDALTTAGRGGADMLERLERENLLIFPLDQERRWYRYHGLFRDLLRARLGRLAPQRAMALHRRAGDWFEAAGELEPAVVHALEAGDPAAAMRRTRAAWMPIMHAGELRTVERWLDALPADVLARDAQLCAVYAWGLVLRREPDGVDARVAAAEAALALPEADPRDVLLVPSQLESIRSIQARLRHDDDAAVAHAEHAIKLVPDGLEPTLDALLRGNALSLLGIAYLARHDDAAAAATFRAAIPLLRRGGNHIGVAHGLRDLVRIEARRGHLASSLRLADEGMQALGSDAGLPAYASVNLACAESLAAMGQRDRARTEAMTAARRALHGGEEQVALEARTLLAALDEGGAGTPARSPVDQLTDREREVLALIAAGRSNAEIAGELFLTVGTVKTHVHAIASKLGAPSRTASVARARELGLLA